MYCELMGRSRGCNHKVKPGDCSVVNVFGACESKKAPRADKCFFHLAAAHVLD